MTEKNLDRKILECLNKNGRDSIRDVASKLEVSPTTVSKHLENMFEKGIIKYFKPVLDYEKLGLELTAITRIQAKGSEISNIVDELVKEERITHVYEITGDFDILAIGKFRNRQSMNDQIKHLLNDPAVEGTNTIMVLNAAKEEENASLE